MATSLTEIPVDHYRLTIERDGDSSIIRLVDAQGGVPLRVELGARGPVLELGSGLSVAVNGCLTFEADRVEIVGRDALCMRSEGDAVLEAAGSIVTRAGRHQRVEALLGGVTVEANDDVDLIGERVRLNC